MKKLTIWSIILGVLLMAITMKGAMAANVVLNTPVTLCGINDTWVNDDLTINTTVTVCDYNASAINCNATVGGSKNCGWIDLRATNLIINGNISADYAGYRGGAGSNTCLPENGTGPGFGQGAREYPLYYSASGAGYGGYGGNSSSTIILGGTPYGSIINVTNLGSGGGGGACGNCVYSQSDDTDGGDGGGFIVLNVSSNLTIFGRITAIGQSKRSLCYPEDSSGGSGGGIKLMAKSVSGMGILNASGGSTYPIASNNNYGASGGGGRIYVLFETNNSFNAVISVKAGTSDVGIPGTTGTLYFEQNSSYFQDAPTISSNASFVNYSSSHQINATVSAQDLDGYADVVSVNYTITNGTCQNLANLTGGNLFNTTWNCSGKALTQFNLTIGFTDSAGYYVSSTGTNTYPNQLPTLASVNINNTAPPDDEDLLCLNGSISDADGDTTTRYYNWLKGGVAQGINSINLSSTLTTTGDTWQCRMWVGDSYQNSTNMTSGSVSIATSARAPVFTRMNATSLSTGLPSDIFNPTNNNTQINLSTNFSDANAADLHTSFFCKDTLITTAGCTNPGWCNSSINVTGNTLACNFSVAGLTASSYQYCVATLDNTSLISSTICDNFHVNHPPSIASFLNLNDTWTNNNFTLLQYSATDSDADVLNYTVWCDNSSTPSTQLLSNSSTSFNWTNLNISRYYCYAQSYDQHGYYSLANSSLLYLGIDYELPVISDATIFPSSIYTDEFTNLSFACSDAMSGVNTALGKYDIIDTLLSYSYALGMSWNSSHFYASPSILGTAGTYNVTNIYCSDVAGNIINTTSTLSFTTATRPVVIGGGGGGGGITKPAEPLQQQPKLETISSKCGDSICDTGEDPLSCPVDCRMFSLEDMFCWPIPECGNWKTAWFTNVIILSVVGGLIYVQYKKSQN